MKRNPLPAKNLFFAYLELTKPKITIMILVTTALGYYVGSMGNLNHANFYLMMLGTGIISGSAATLNNYFERDFDKIMDRTKSRPIPILMIKPFDALVFALLQFVIGLTLLILYSNSITVLLAICTVFLYVFIYTPLKRITWLNTTVGAIPGALPPLGGWAAATGNLSVGGWILFAILFIWQHPHFYAIALMCREDYKKAGFKMLPALENESKRTNRQIVWHAFILIPVSLFLNIIGLTGEIYFYGSILIGLIYLIGCLPLVKSYSIKNAKLLLGISVIYLPSLFLLILLDTNF
jgi:protoheme IX farnesyltransferase